MYKKMKPSGVNRSLQIKNELLQRVFDDTPNPDSSCIQPHSKMLSEQGADTTEHHEDIVSIYLTLMRTLKTKEEANLFKKTSASPAFCKSKRAAQPGCWYDILEYHSIQFTIKQEIIDGAGLDVHINPEYTQDHPLFEYIDKYLYTTQKDTYQDFPPLGALSDLSKIFTMYVHILGYTETIQNICTVFGDLSEGKIYPNVYSVGDVERVKEIRFEEIKENREMEESLVRVFESQKSFMLLVGLWKQVNLEYEEYKAENGGLDEKYRLFMNLEFLSLEKSGLKERIKDLDEFKQLDISTVVRADELTEAHLKKNNEPSEEAKEEIKEEVKEEVKEETKEPPQEEDDDWEAEEDKAFLQNFSQNLSDLMPQNEPAQEIIKEVIVEDKRVFTALETIHQITNCIKYFILDKKSADEILAQLKAVHNENVLEYNYVKKMTFFYSIPNLNQNARNMINRWMNKKMKQKSTFISRDYFLSCIKMPTDKLTVDDKQRYGMLVSALLFQSLKDEKQPVSQKSIKSLIKASGASIPENSLWLSLITDPYTLEKLDRGIWTNSITEMFNELDERYTSTNPEPIDEGEVDVAALFGGDDDDY